MLKLVLYPAGAVLLLLGGEGLYHAINTRRQSSLTCDELVRQRPRDGWLRVSGCEVDYIGAGFRESGSHIQELLFPVRPAGRPRTEPAVLVAATRDPSVLAMAEDTIGNGRRPDQEQYLVMMLRIVTALRASREIDGVTRAGLLQQARTRRLLSGLSSPVAPDAILIDLHARPDPIIPAALSGAGVAALAAALVLTLRGRRQPRPIEPEAAAAAAAVPETPAPAVTGTEAALAAPARLRVLLLNLTPSDGADAIEHAPALGDLGQVRASILQHFPAVRFDERNRGVLGDGDESLTIDLGEHDPVQTAVVDARGAANVAGLARLLADKRWRAYAPGTGAFLDLDRLAEPAQVRAEFASTQQ